MRSIAIGTLAFVLAGTVAASARISSEQKDRIRESAAVLDDIHGQPDKAIPPDLWDKAQCVVVIPSLKKIAFVFGGEYGKGLMSCRQHAAWSAPVFMQIEKGSWGAQI
ncbi:MAG TPA: lipid-binding SYLF domain-containing protein, partial [Vicinamibacterales bacterium]|nr:lipid-binding SYLF domain-containing protein [Vicinamibacterales bacterium]